MRLNRTNSGFDTDNETIEKLYRYLGEIETNPKNPTVYMKNGEVLDKFGEKVTYNVTKPNWTDLSKPRTKIRYVNRINRDKLPSKDLLRKNNL